MDIFKNFIRASIEDESGDNEALLLDHLENATQVSQLKVSVEYSILDGESDLGLCVSQLPDKDGLSLRWYADTKLTKSFEMIGPLLCSLKPKELDLELYGCEDETLEPLYQFLQTHQQDNMPRFYFHSDDPSFRTRQVVYDILAAVSRNSKIQALKLAFGGMEDDTTVEEDDTTVVPSEWAVNTTLIQLQMGEYDDQLIQLLWKNFPGLHMLDLGSIAGKGAIEDAFKFMDANPHPTMKYIRFVPHSENLYEKEMEEYGTHEEDIAEYHEEIETFEEEREQYCERIAQVIKHGFSCPFSLRSETPEGVENILNAVADSPKSKFVALDIDFDQMACTNDISGIHKALLRVLSAPHSTLKSLKLRDWDNKFCEVGSIQSLIRDGLRPNKSLLRLSLQHRYDKGTDPTDYVDELLSLLYNPSDANKTITELDVELDDAPDHWDPPSIQLKAQLRLIRNILESKSGNNAKQQNLALLPLLMENAVASCAYTTTKHRMEPLVLYSCVKTNIGLVCEHWRGVEEQESSPSSVLGKRKLSS